MAPSLPRTMPRRTVPPSMSMTGRNTRACACSSPRTGWPASRSRQIRRTSPSPARTGRRHDPSCLPWQANTGRSTGTTAVRGHGTSGAGSVTRTNPITEDRPARRQPGQAGRNGAQAPRHRRHHAAQQARSPPAPAGRRTPDANQARKIDGGRTAKARASHPERRARRQQRTAQALMGSAHTRPGALAPDTPSRIIEGRDGRFGLEPAPALGLRVLRSDRSCRLKRQILSYVSHDVPR